MEQEYENDYSLLRPFDLEAAKRGELLCWRDGDGPLEYVGEYVAENGERIFRWIGGDVAGKLGHYKAEQLRVAPLAWVEGKPVYKGDVLYQECLKREILGVTPDGRAAIVDTGCVNLCYLTWTPPKVKREVWVNVYQDFKCGIVIHATRNIADREASPNRLACIHIEWEEPAGQEGGAK